MNIDAVVAGSLGFLGDEALRALLELDSSSDVVLLPTAAAFTGAAEAALQAAHALEMCDAHVEALMVIDRASANESYFAQRIAQAQWVVLLDGSPLHARTTWRESAVGEALASARLLALGATATVIGDEMIDPRGGAPTTGLGYRAGGVFTIGASDDQIARTRHLLGETGLLIVIEESGVVVHDAAGWRQWSAAGVTCSRHDALSDLERFSSR